MLEPLQRYEGIGHTHANSANKAGRSVVSRRQISVGTTNGLSCDLVIVGVDASHMCLPMRIFDCLGRVNLVHGHSGQEMKE